MQIADIQVQAQELRAAQGWTSDDPAERLAYLMTEVGEVAREVLEIRRGGSGDGARERLGMEIYDVVWNLCDLANLLDVGLEVAFEKKAAINAARRW